MVAVRIRAKQAADVIGMASKLFPLPQNLSHLKRVRKQAGEEDLQVIICPANAHDPDNGAESRPQATTCGAEPDTAACTSHHTPIDCNTEDEPMLGAQIPKLVCCTAELSMHDLSSVEDKQKYTAGSKLPAVQKLAILCCNCPGPTVPGTYTRALGTVDAALANSMASSI